MLFPAPLGPTIPVSVPEANSNETDRRTERPANETVTFLARSAIDRDGEVVPCGRDVFTD